MNFSSEITCRYHQKPIVKSRELLFNLILLDHFAFYTIDFLMGLPVSYLAFLQSIHCTDAHRTIQNTSIIQTLQAATENPGIPAILTSSAAAWYGTAHIPGTSTYQPVPRGAVAHMPLTSMPALSCAWHALSPSSFPTRLPLDLWTGSNVISSVQPSSALLYLSLSPSTVDFCTLHMCVCVCVQSCFSHVWLFVTPWTIAHQTPLSLGFSRQEYWSGLPCPPPEDLSNPAIEPSSLTSPALAGRFFTTSATWEAHITHTAYQLVECMITINILGPT